MPAAALRVDDWAGAHTFLAAVELRMVELLERRSGPVSAAAQAAVAAGGKRLRPLLVLAGVPLAAASPDLSGAVKAAAAVEFVHTASLVHDDVLDRAVVRRGQATTVRQHGHAVAVAAGDLLFSLAFASLVDSDGEERTQRAVSLLAHAARMLAEGEALQSSQEGDTDIDLDQYLRRCELKTGVLFGVALALGAVQSGASQPDVSVLQRVGTQIGVAFQLTDDLLDCTGSAQSLGKQPGADVRDGTMTMPLLLGARRDHRVRELLRAGTSDAATVEHLLERVASTGALDDTRQAAFDMVRSAIASVGEVGPEYDLVRLREIAWRAVRRLT